MVLDEMSRHRYHVREDAPPLRLDPRQRFQEAKEHLAHQVVDIGREPYPSTDEATDGIVKLAVQSPKGLPLSALASDHESRQSRIAQRP